MKNMREVGSIRRKTIRQWLVAAIVVATALTGASAQQTSAQEAVQQDPVLRAMSLEMQRSKDQLRLENMQRPYYIEYSIVDADLYTAEAAYGAIRQENSQHIRMLRAVVRIGDYKQDSYFQAGEGAMDFVPVDDDVLALRHQLWLVTDSAYKQAIQALTQKQAVLKQFEGDPGADDFSREPASQFIAPLGKLDVNPAPYREALKNATALYATDPDLQTLEGQAVFRVQTHYFMNSEGSVVRQPEAAYMVLINGGTQAPDGLRLDRSQSWVVATAKELPIAEQVKAGTEKLIATLASLRKAPLVEDEYHGPVLFSADASDSVFARLVAGSIAGRKPRPGQTSRTIGDYASSYKSRVLPDFLTLVDDPTVQTFGGRTLMGSYGYDDEGVKARAVNVVENGVLVNYLIGRQPIRDFPASNGHGRSASITGAAPAIGNLFIKSSQPQSFAAMKEKMLQMCKDQGLQYGYIVQAVGRNLAPELLTRVWVKDGHEELVRGAEFQQLDTRALRSDLIAAGDDTKVDNRVDAVPDSIIGPSVLFGDLQIKRSSTAKEKLPDYPPPGVKIAQAPTANKSVGK